MNKKNTVLILATSFIILFTLGCMDNSISSNTPIPIENNTTSKLKIEVEKDVIYQKNEVVSTAFIDQKGIIWFGTNTEGLYRYDGSSFRNFSIQEGLKNTCVKAITEDNQGNIWLGTADGLYFYDHRSFTHVPIPCDDCENIWGNGLGANQVLCIETDQKGNIWIGTWGGGAFMFDPRQIPRTDDDFTSYLANAGRKQSDGEFHNVISSITATEDGNIWFTSMTHGGVYSYDGDSFQHWMTDDGISEDMVTSCLEDKAGNLWFGYLGNKTGGIDKFDGENFINYNQSHGLPNSNTVCLMEDQSGRIWTGSQRGDLSIFDGKQFTTFTYPNKETFEGILFVLEDSKGNIWFGGNHGALYQYNGKTLIDYTQKRI